MGGIFSSDPYEITCSPKWASSFVVETEDEQSLRESIDAHDGLGNDKLWYFEINGSAVKELPKDYFASTLTVILTKMSPPNTHVVDPIPATPQSETSALLKDPR